MFDLRFSVCGADLSAVVDLLHDSAWICRRRAGSAMETQTAAAHDRFASAADGLLRELQLDDHHPTRDRSQRHRRFHRHRTSVLRVHGHASGLLHQRNQHPGRHQRTGSRTVARHRRIHHRVQLHSNLQRLGRREAPAVSLLHVSLSLDDAGVVEV